MMWVLFGDELLGGAGGGTLGDGLVSHLCSLLVDVVKYLDFTSYMFLVYL